ncbi:MAG TPA: PadR family transcriptional regulator [Bacillota bacterium]|nr:PadR family transcriptional regulator [Bacillota bacterium]
MDSQIYQNYKTELRRGTQILIVLSQLDKQEYGYSLLQKMIDQGVSIEAGTLYPLMRRLESQGLLESEWDTSESRPRKYYKLSKEGHELYGYLTQEWSDIVNEVNTLIGGNVK